MTAPVAGQNASVEPSLHPFAGFADAVALVRESVGLTSQAIAEMERAVAWGEYSVGLEWHTAAPPRRKGRPPGLIPGLPGNESPLKPLAGEESRDGGLFWRERNQLAARCGVDWNLTSSDLLWSSQYRGYSAKNSAPRAKPISNSTAILRLTYTVRPMRS